MKKGRFCFETHQKIRILYVVLRYVMYVDKLLFWHWQNAQHAAQQRKIHRERKGARPRMGERESVLGKAILSGNNIIQSVCML